MVWDESLLLPPKCTLGRSQEQIFHITVHDNAFVKHVS